MTGRVQQPSSHVPFVSLLIGALTLAACDGTTAPETPPPPPSEPHSLELTIPVEVELRGVVGTVLSPAPAVRVTDQDGRPAVGVLVTFTAQQGELLGTARVPTDAMGMATAAWRLGRVAGEQTLTAQLRGSSVTFTALARSGPGVTLRIHSGDEQRGSVGKPLDRPLQVQLLDLYANPVPDMKVSFSAVQGSGAIAVDTALTDTRGLATSGVWHLGPQPGRQQAVARSGLHSSAVFTATSCEGEPCQQILFERQGNLFLQDGISAEPRPWTHSGGHSRPAWSPDGEYIAFARDGLYVMNAGGRNLRLLGAGMHSPSWSPDGTRLAAAQGNCVYQCVVYVLDVADPSQTRFLADMARDPAWSPDGSTIAYVSLSGDDGYDALYVITLDGGHVREVMPREESSILTPRWSPDGSRVAFVRCGGGVGECAIFVMQADGTKLQRLTDGREPSWSPDGGMIAYTRYTGTGIAATPSVVIIPAQGGESTSISSPGRSPAWRP